MVQGYIYILPSLFFMVCFCLLPIFMSTYFSFTDYDIMTKADFVGVDNYSKIFSDKYIIDLCICNCDRADPDIFSSGFRGVSGRPDAEYCRKLFKKRYVYSGYCIVGYGRCDLENHFRN